MSLKVHVEWRGISAFLHCKEIAAGSFLIQMVYAAPGNMPGEDAGAFFSAIARCNHWFAELPDSPAMTAAEIISIFSMLEPDAPDLAIARALEDLVLIENKGRAS